ncbi:hypothetical protein STEG23_036213 [Scotinomys teguina]
MLLILLMSAVMLLPGTNGSLLLVQRTVTRTIVLQETIGKGKLRGERNYSEKMVWSSQSENAGPGMPPHHNGRCLSDEIAIWMSSAIGSMFLRLLQGQA